MYTQVNIYTVTTFRSPKQTSGSIGYLIEVPTEKGPATRLEYEDVEDMTTNGAEILAIVSALRRIKQEKLTLDIYTDCAYVANAIKNGWITKWQQNNWNNEKGKEISNRELWEEMLILLHGKDISIHVKEHHSYTNCMEFEIEQRREKQHV